MKPWREVITPHEDIRRGGFDESVFAADLSDVLANRGPVDYRDALTFCAKTYHTQGLVNLGAAVASRLAGKGSGEPVIQIQTPFGGGKTHSLIALYHLFRGVEGLEETDLARAVLNKAGLSNLPKARVVTFVGTETDTLKRTIWGHLAEQLGNYDLLREHDEKRRSPGKDNLHRLLAGQPTLILLDEIVEYAVKARDYPEQIIAFFQELTETVKVLPQCALVATLPSSVPYGETGERRLSELQRVFGRVEAIYTPVEGEEVYEVIRRRLFQNTPDAAEVSATAESYWRIYQTLGDDIPRHVREPAYREKIRKAYPFHPELIDILYERWSTYANFQRTRGVLRLLALIIADLYKREHSAPLIQPAHINLVNASIRREFLKHIGNEYDGVIAADIADGNAKAQKIDNEMGSEYAKFGIASGLATAIFFGSFSGSESKGIGIQRLRLAILREGIPPAIIGDALGRMEDELWYLHVEHGIYSFSTQPNLNRVIIEKEDGVREENISDEIKRQVAKLAGTDMKTFCWPRETQDVPDTKELKLAVLSPECSMSGGGSGAFADELFKKSGITFRTYQNTLVVLAPNTAELAALRPQVKRLLALRAIKDDKALMRQLSDDNKNTLQSRLSSVESDVPFKILSAYRHVAKAGPNGAEWHDMGLPTVGEKGPLSKRVLDYLKSEILLTTITPDKLLRTALNENEQEKPVTEIYEAFLKFPQFPMIASESVVKTAVATGVREGTFGIRVGDRIYINEELPYKALDAGAILVRKEFVVKTGEDVPPVKSEGEVQPGRVQEPPPGVEVVAPLVGGFRRVRLRAKVPWDKLSDFLRGVVMPLWSDGAEMEVEIFVQAHSDSGSIRQSTLDQSVRETLRQIGAEVLEDTAE
ncbi:MAG: DUF499 domain-containing protein [Armatimonadota bacterium]|nr:DUF499 domain-containing protein [Armatimonadota bacterium]